MPAPNPKTSLLNAGRSSIIFSLRIDTLDRSTYAIR